MAVSSRALVELVLLGPTNDRRQLQDSPVLGDVWIAYAVKPADAIDLLITPHKTQAAGPVAVRIAKRLNELKIRRERGQESQIAYLQGLVAARLFFEELLRVIVPMTQWWGDRNVQQGLQEYVEGTRLRKRIQAVIDWTRAGDEDAQAQAAAGFAEFSALDRYVSLAGIILWSSTQPKKKAASLSAGDALSKLNTPAPIVKLLGEVFGHPANLHSTHRLCERQLAGLHTRSILAAGIQVPTMQVQDWQSTRISALVTATNKQQKTIRLS